MSHAFKAVANFGESIFGFHGLKGMTRALGAGGINGIKAAAGGDPYLGMKPSTPSLGAGSKTPAMPDYNYLQQKQQNAINAMRLRSGRLSTILSQPSDQLGG